MNLKFKEQKWLRTACFDALMTRGLYGLEHGYFRALGVFLNATHRAQQQRRVSAAGNRWCRPFESVTSCDPLGRNGPLLNLFMFYFLPRTPTLLTILFWIPKIGFSVKFFFLNTKKNFVLTVRRSLGPCRLWWGSAGAQRPFGSPGTRDPRLAFGV